MSSRSFNAVSRLLLAATLGFLRVSVPAQEMLAPPAPVVFDSVDYKNILRWTPPTNSSSLLYYVQWKIYGEVEWLDVDSCQGVQQHQCDLSRQTSEAREWYYGRVRASSPSAGSNSAWALSRRFSPRLDTKISPPALRLNLTERGIVVRVKPPRPQVRKAHSGLRYKIYVLHPSGEEEVISMDCCSSKLTLKDLHRKTRYCLQAQLVAPLQTRSSARGPVRCVSTP